MITEHRILLVSNAVMGQIKKEPSTQAKFISGGVEVRASSFLPFRPSYRACDILTKKEIEILGDEVNAVIVPVYDFKTFTPNLFTEPCA